jgi:gliding motility-associated-like protein
LKFINKITFCLSLVIAVLLVSKVSYAQLQFIENKGQWDSRVDFKSDISNGVFFLQKDGFTVVLHNIDDLKKFADARHGHVTSDSAIITPGTSATARKGDSPLPVSQNNSYTIHSHAYRVDFLGGAHNAIASPDKPLDTYNNYFIGNDPAKWKGNCKIYQGVTYKNVYPNIDVRYYTDAGTLKYDLIVHPGGRVSDIALRYQGVDKLEVKNKELIIGTSVGEVKELYPYTYQVEATGRTTVDCKYVVKDNIVRFKVKDYSPEGTIIIDPTLIFASFTGSTTDNWGYTATPGPDGSFFAGGISFGAGYPASPGAFDQTYNGGGSDPNGPYDIAIIKLSANGVNRLYGTYLGGNGGDEQPHSMICDPRGNLIVAGRTTSSDYPVFPANNTIGALGGYDIVVTKFNSSGTALIGSVKIGGDKDDGVNIKPKYVPLDVPGRTDGAFETRRNYGDDARSEVILDGAGDIYLASCTQSDNFPSTSGAFQKTYGGGRQDGLILKFTPDLGGLIFSTFFGGSGTDACFVLTYNPALNNFYVGGGTTSPTLPGAAGGSPEPGISGTYLGGETDGFVTEIKADGSAIIKTIFAGTGGNDLVYGVQIDKFGSPYIMGATTGSWPVKNAVFKSANGRQFIAKLTPDLSSFVYSTVFGSGSPIPNISPVAFLVDRCQNVYVSGWGGKFNNELGYPCAGTNGLPVTANALKSATDGGDFYFFVLERNATSQLFGSFYGQTGGFDDHVDGGTSRFDAQGVIYTAICANCGGPKTPGFFPTTPGVWASVNGSSNCNEAMVKIEMNFGGVIASLAATINGVIDTVGCVPLTITFVDTLAKGKVYIWNYGDPASPKNDTTYAPNNFSSHTYTNVGVYKITLITIDSSSCNFADTAYTTVKVGNNVVTPDFFATKIPPCSNLSYNFTNTTTAVIPSFTPNSFLWDFGDGSPQVRAGLNTVQHTYTSVGTYNVKLVVDDTSFCNAPDSVTHQVRLSVVVKAQFETPANGCVPYNAQFTNTSLGGIDFLWDFGDGSTSTAVDPTHLYPVAGTYTVKLIAYDSSTCNKIDSTTLSISIFNIPTANFTASPNPGLENKPTQFTNLSVGSSSYSWNFGDGGTSTEVNPLYQFTSTGTFNVCLQAISPAGCIDTFCLDVSAKVSPLVAVPNAFTPGKFGKNSIIKVEGFGIGKMTWNIYNRWGQLVFSSSDKSQGWNGTFKGALQPMDVYAYTLDIQFTDGQKLKKTGDISLLR